MDRLTRAFAFVAGFGLARGALFAAPLLAANLLPLEVYGKLELAQAIAALAALILGLGLQGSVPLVLLRDEVTARWDTLLLLLLVLSSAGAILAVTSYILLQNQLSLLVLVLLGVTALSLQGLWATWLKTHESGTAAVFLEAGFWCALVAGATLVAVWGAPLWSITAMLALYGGVLLYKTFRAFQRAHAPFSTVDLSNNIRVGVPLMLTSSITLLLSSAGRLVLGTTSDFSTVATYSALFRATTIPLVAHQLLIIAFFRRIFVWEISTLQRRAPLIIVGVATSVAAFWTAEPYIGWILGPTFVHLFNNNSTVGHMILLQMILWSAIAMNDLLTSRQQIAGRVAQGTGPLLLLSLVVLVGLVKDNENALQRFVVLHSLTMAGFYILQSALMWWQGQAFWRLWAISLGTFGIGWLILAVGEYSL